MHIHFWKAAAAQDYGPHASWARPTAGRLPDGSARGARSDNLSVHVATWNVGNEVPLGLGRIVALYYRPSTVYQIH